MDIIVQCNGEVMFVNDKRMVMKGEQFMVRWVGDLDEEVKTLSNLDYAGVRQYVRQKNEEQKKYVR